MNHLSGLHINRFRSGKTIVQYLSLVFSAFVLFMLGVMVPLAPGFLDSMIDWNGLATKKPLIGFCNYKQ